jgi:hypothetical protein
MLLDAPITPSKPECLALAYITDEELKTTKRLLARDKLQAVRDKLIAAGNIVDLTDT